MNVGWYPGTYLYIQYIRFSGIHLFYQWIMQLSFKLPDISQHLFYAWKRQICLVSNLVGDEKAL